MKVLRLNDMSSFYRFSPISNRDELFDAVDYVTKQALLLSQKAIDQELPISYLTIFAHYETEYDELVSMVKELGELSEANNGVKVLLNEKIANRGQSIGQLRIRRPDPYRTQVGCCDFSVQDYADFKQTNLANNKNLRLIERPDYEMIEFFDPDFDVFAYIVS
jgi:hypothetical protein